jgi:prophage regulatory protein
MSDKLLPIESVLDAIGVKRTKLYAMVARGEFPQPVKVGALSRWPESEVVAFQEKRKAARSGQAVSA